MNYYFFRRQTLQELYDKPDSIFPNNNIKEDTKLKGETILLLQTVDSYIQNELYLNVFCLVQK